MKNIAKVIGLGLINASLVAMSGACGTEGTDGIEGVDSTADVEEVVLPDDAVKVGDAELFGAELSVDVEVVDFDALIEEPASFTERTIQTEGIVRANCTKRGCWMEVRSLMDSASESITVRFLDYGFFVPLDSRGGIVRFEGVADVETLSAAEVEHLIAEGYDPGIVEEDGTATVISFTATGVEMWNRNLD